MMRTAVLALALLCLVQPVASAQESLPAVRTEMLRNGLRVLLAPDSSTTSVDVAVWYGAGSRWDRAGASGLSHLVERLQFRGSARVPDGEHRRELIAAGGTVNTNSTTDYVSLWETLPPEALDRALELEADRMERPSITPASVDQERRAIADERRRVVDRNPLGRALLRLTGLLFAGHPYANGPLGSAADLAQATPKSVEAWWRERFGPANALLTVAGRFDPEATLATIRRRFEPLPRRGTGAPTRLPALAPLDGARAFEPIEGAGALLVAGWRGPGANDPDAAAGALLARLLAGAVDSRLPAALQGEGTSVLSVQSGWESRRDASFLWAAAAVRPGADSARIEHELLTEVRRLAAQAPEGAELDQARKRVLVPLLFGLQTPRGRASALGEGVWLTGDASAVQQRMAAIRRVTPEEVRRFAERLVRDDAQAVVWLRGTATATEEKP